MARTTTALKVVVEWNLWAAIVVDLHLRWLCLFQSCGLSTLQQSAYVSVYIERGMVALALMMMPCTVCL